MVIHTDLIARDKSGDSDHLGHHSTKYAMSYSTRQIDQIRDLQVILLHQTYGYRSIHGSGLDYPVGPFTSEDPGSQLRQLNQIELIKPCTHRMIVGERISDSHPEGNQRVEQIVADLYAPGQQN